MKAKITDEQLKECLLANMTKAAIAKMYGIHERNVYHRASLLARRGFAPAQGLTDEYEEGFVLGKVTIQKADGVVERTWERMVLDNDKMQTLIRESFEAMAANLPRFKPTVIEHIPDTDLLTIYPLGDPHIGMMSWGQETGVDWDLKIADRYFCKAFDRVVHTAPPSGECLILNLGDFFHADNMEGQTTRSKHSLDVDGRYAKMVQVGVKIMRQMINTALTRHQVVHVINCIGNHDDTSALFLSVLLLHAYENEPRVIIDTSPTPFHFKRWGRCLIGAHHGHTCKMPNLPGVMAAQKPKDWGDTFYRYWYTGHIHHDSAKEYPGVKVESFRTLAAKDAYAAWGGYESGQDIKAIVLHKQRGEIERHTVHIDHLKTATGKHL